MTKSYLPALEQTPLLWCPYVTFYHGIIKYSFLTFKEDISLKARNGRSLPTT